MILNKTFKVFKTMKTPRNQKVNSNITILLDGLRAWLGLTWGYPDQAFLFAERRLSHG